jgi:hypothetical protein
MVEPLHLHLYTTSIPVQLQVEILKIGVGVAERVWSTKLWGQQTQTVSLK